MKTPSLLAATFLAAIFLGGCEDIRTEKHPNGNIRFEAHYVNDQKEGLEKEFYDNGSLKRETNYLQGKRHGETREYYRDGTPEAQFNYENGLIEGIVTRYHKNGKVASRIPYKANKQAGFGEYYSESGEAATSGGYKDPRDNYAYEWILIGEQLWIAENLNYATATGSLCQQCNNWGRLYNLENARKACMEGFHIPNKAQWQELLAFVGEKPGLKLKAGFGWDDVPKSNKSGNGKDDFGFGAKAGGAHFAKSDVPMDLRKFDDAGKKAYFWTEEGEVLVFHYDKDNAKFEKFNPEFGASLRCIKD
ncbi:MAG: hypothetical protein HUK20_03440 [Fibrobacter sp.]|nr:hypothetical protein [Fibrobacter sp.]